MRSYLLGLLLCLLFCSAKLLAQDSIDGAYPFQNDPAKKYSLYVPSSYDASTPQALMLGLHPFNTNRWDAQAWRDTLIVFAETNDLLLVCPDGGLDGQIDSPIDTAFTSDLMDSVAVWYNVDPNEKYIMGFSWGGKTTYTYGLRRTHEFKGFMPIGAAVTIGEVNALIENATDQPFYLVHGSNDAQGTRYTPLLQALEANDACVQTELLAGVGHTIDFPNRNAILTTAFEFLKNSDCGRLDAVSEIKERFTLSPNPSNGRIDIKGISDYSVEVYDLKGQKIQHDRVQSAIQLDSQFTGVAIISITKNGQTTTQSIVVR